MVKNKLKKALLLSAIALCLNKENVDAKTLDDYLQEQIEFYKENPDYIELDLHKDEILIENRGNSYFGLVNYSVSNLEPKIGDYVYVWGKGKETSDGRGIETKDLTPTVEEYQAKVIVKVKPNEEYPYAIASVNEDNSLSDIIGWFKKDNLSVRVLNYSNVIEAPIVKDLEYNSLADDSYTKINDNYSIKVFYSKSKLKEDYYLNQNGLYVDEYYSSVKRQRLDDEKIKELKK